MRRVQKLKKKLEPQVKSKKERNNVKRDKKNCFDSTAR